MVLYKGKEKTHKSKGVKFMTEILFENLVEEMEQASAVERENKFKELFPKAKVTITNIGVEYSSTFLHANYKYRVTITNEGKRMSFTFHGSVADYQSGADPTVLDVLYAITMDCHCFTDVNDIYGFCREFGYDEDRGVKVYKACEKAYNSMVRVFGEDGRWLVDAIVRNY